MRNRLIVSFFVLLTVVTFSATAGSAADLFSGSWKMNVAKSTYSLKLNGKVASVNTNVVSKDGRVRTTTQTGTNAQGQAINNIVIYEKQ